MSLLIIITIFLLIAIIVLSNKSEPFYYIGKKIHITLDNNNDPLNFSYQMSPANGKSGCAIIPCPKFTGCYSDLNKYNNTYVCWSCDNFY